MPLTREQLESVLSRGLLIGDTGEGTPPIISQYVVSRSRPDGMLDTSLLKWARPELAALLEKLNHPGREHYVPRGEDVIIYEYVDGWNVSQGPVFGAMGQFEKRVESAQAVVELVFQLFDCEVNRSDLDGTLVHSNSSSTLPPDCSPYDFLLNGSLACWRPHSRKVMYVLVNDNDKGLRYCAYLRRMGRSFKTKDEFARYAESEGWPGHESILSDAGRDDSSDDGTTQVSAI